MGGKDNAIRAGVRGESAQGVTVNVPYQMQGHSSGLWFTMVLCHACNAGASEGSCTVQGKQMQALARCSGPDGQALLGRLASIVSPMRETVWAQELAGHPDKALVDELLRGIKSGFRVGYDKSLAPLKAHHRNMQLATEHREVVTKYLTAEIEAGRVVLVGTAEALGIHCSPFGVIPKKSKPGKFRLILNLSAPEGASVNDGISKELATLSYVSLDQVADSAARLGRGLLLAKMDIKQAYRQVLVHPQDRRLLGMLWEDNVYVDTTLPFGLRSAPLVFTAVVDAAQWVMKKQGISQVFHYVDDFITLGANATECSRNNTIMHEVCSKLGLPAEPRRTRALLRA